MKKVLGFIQKQKQICIIILAVIIMILIGVISTNYNGNVVPFEIKKIYVTSNVNAKYADENNTKDWNLKLLQNNDIYVDIGTVENIEKVNKKQSRIKEIYIENFKFDQGPFLGTSIELYKLQNNTEKLFQFEDAYKFEDKINYIVVEENANLYNCEVNKDGGQLAISIVNNDIKDLKVKNETELNIDGTLLNRAEVKGDEITFVATFDIVLITENNKEYVSNISLNLPTGNIIEEGFGLNENVDVTSFQFKKKK